MSMAMLQLNIRNRVPVRKWLKATPNPAQIKAHGMKTKKNIAAIRLTLTKALNAEVVNVEIALITINQALGLTH